MRNAKRILSVTIKSMVDDSPDTSYLGEYSSKSSSEFSIDRQHTEDCPINKPPVEALAQVDRVLNYLFEQRREIEQKSDEYWTALDEACDILDEAKSELAACDCGESGEWMSREYQYFNPSFNYVDKAGNPSDGLTADDVRKYTRQDYERMEAANRGDWTMMGIRTEADIQITSAGPIQTISSMGLWGIESDSDDSYIEEVKDEQLHELRSQLKALGFSSRAISKAFKSAEDKDGY